MTVPAVKAALAMRVLALSVTLGCQSTYVDSGEAQIGTCDANGEDREPCALRRGPPRYPKRALDRGGDDRGKRPT